jgi:hypothetical protein
MSVIEVNNVKPILHFLTVHILTVMPETPCLELHVTNGLDSSCTYRNFEQNRLINNNIDFKPL